MRAYNLHKGLNLASPDWRLEEGELPELTNFVYGSDGLPHKRRGLVRVVQTSPGPTPVDGLYRAAVGGKPPHTLVATGGELYAIYDGTSKWTSVTSGLASGKPYRFETFMDKVYIVNGENGLLEWDGDSLTEVPGPPTGSKFVRAFSDRLFVGSSLMGPDAVAYSDLFDPTVWKDMETEIDNLIDISPGDDQWITGIVRTRDQLTFFKSHSTYYLFGYDPYEWELIRVADGVGCIAPDSVVEIDARTIWLSDRGIYLDDGRNFQRIGARVQPFINKLTREQQEKAVATKAGWHYYLFFPDTPYGCVALIYNVRLDAWSYWELGVDIKSVAAMNLPLDEPGWLAGDANQALIYWGEQGGTDDGKGITAHLRLPTIGLDAPEVFFVVRRIAVDARVDENDEAILRWRVGDHPPVERPVNPNTIYSGERKTGKSVSISVEISGSGTESVVNGLAAQIIERRRLW